MKRFRGLLIGLAAALLGMALGRMVEFKSQEWASPSKSSESEQSPPIPPGYELETSDTRSKSSPPGKIQYPDPPGYIEPPKGFVLDKPQIESPDWLSKYPEVLPAGFFGESVDSPTHLLALQESARWRERFKLCLLISAAVTIGLIGLLLARFERRKCPRCKARRIGNYCSHCGAVISTKVSRKPAAAPTTAKVAGRAV